MIVFNYRQNYENIFYNPAVWRIFIRQFGWIPFGSLAQGYNGAIGVI